MKENMIVLVGCLLLKQGLLLDKRQETSAERQLCVLTIVCTRLDIFTVRKSSLIAEPEIVIFMYWPS